MPFFPTPSSGSLFLLIYYYLLHVLLFRLCWYSDFAPVWSLLWSPSGGNGLASLTSHCVLGFQLSIVAVLPTNNYFPSTTESLSSCLFFTFLLSYSSSYSSEKLKVFSACHIMHLKSFFYLCCDFLLSVLPHKIFLCIHLECSSPFPHFIFFYVYLDIDSSFASCISCPSSSLMRCRRVSC